MRSTFKCTQCSRQRQSHVTRAVQGCPTPGRMTTIVSLLPQLRCLQRVPLAAWFVKVVFGVSIFAFPAPMRKDCAVPAHRSPSQALGTPSRALGVRAWLPYCSRLLLFVAAWCTQGTDIWCSGGRYLAKGGQDVQFEIPTPLPDIWQRVLAMQISGTCLPPDIRPSVRGSIRYLAW